MTLSLTQKDKESIARRLALDALQGYEYMEVIESTDDELDESDADDILDLIRSATVIINPINS